VLQGGVRDGQDRGARVTAGARIACTPVELDRRWPRPPARWPAREGGRQGCSLAAMAAVGIRLGSADEGSLPEGRASLVACIPVERDSRNPPEFRLPSQLWHCLCPLHNPDLLFCQPVKLVD